MKVPAFINLLALGLLAASPATAAPCRPSKSPTPSSSSVPSSSPSPSVTPPAPVCGVNIVKDSNFYDAAVNGIDQNVWQIDAPDVDASNTCPAPNTECAVFNMPGDAAFSQDLDTTAVGQYYTFSMEYIVWSVYQRNNLTCTATSTPADGEEPITTTMAVPIHYVETGEWLTFTSSFEAMGDVTTLTCSFTHTEDGAPNMMISDVQVELNC